MSDVEDREYRHHTRAGAQRLADRINAYWRERGIDARARVVTENAENYHVRSNLRFHAKPALYRDEVR